jgi:hypothetical protein
LGYSDGVEDDRDTLAEDDEMGAWQGSRGGEASVLEKEVTTLFHIGGLEETCDGESLVSGLSLKNPSSLHGGCSAGRGSGGGAEQGRGDVMFVGVSHGWRR